MKSMIKDGVYVAVMVVMSFGESFGSDNPNQLQPGCYGNSGIYQYPAGSSVPLAQVNSYPVINSASMPDSFGENSQQKFPEQEETLLYWNQQKQQQQKELQEQQQKQQVQQQQQLENDFAQKHRNTTGIASDARSSLFVNSDYSCGALWNEISSFKRHAENSGLFIIRIGNTYKETYCENNKNSTLVDIGFFNTYEKGKTIDNANSTRFHFSLGDVVKEQSNICGKDVSSTNISFSINKNIFLAFMSALIAAKIGIIGLLASTTGVPAIIIFPLYAGVACVPEIYVLGIVVSLFLFKLCPDLWFPAIVSLLQCMAFNYALLKKEDIKQ